MPARENNPDGTPTAESVVALLNYMAEVRRRMLAGEPPADDDESETRAIITETTAAGPLPTDPDARRAEATRRAGNYTRGHEE